MVPVLAILLALQSKLNGCVVVDDSPVRAARVIVGELGHATLFYNTPEEMFVGTPGLAESEAARFSAVLATDAEGRFSVDGLAPGEYSLIAADPQRGIACAKLRLEQHADLRLVLQRPAIVAATIEGLAFDPAVDVLVLKPRDAAANVTFVPRLEQQAGAWSFRSVALPDVARWKAVGTRGVQEHDFAALLFSLPVEARAGETAQLAFALDGGASVSGRVTDASGAAASGVSVVAAAGADPARALGAVSDADGRYRIAGLTPGRWNLEALRFGMRDVPGCGNGPLEWFGARSVTVAAGSAQVLDLRLEASPAPPKPGELAPEFTATALDGALIRLSELRGKVVLLDFWATWCGMCRAELPRLVAAHAELAASQRFEIVGISVDDDADLVRRFVASRGMRWPQTAQGSAANNPLARLYNVHSTPSTVLIGADGRVVALNLTGAALRAKIEELLAAH